MPGPVLEYKTAVLPDQLTLTEPSAPNPLGIATVIVAVTGVVDEVKDLIEPGAFARTLAERPSPKVCLGHDWNRSIGKTLDIKELLPGDPGLPKETGDGRPWPAAAGAVIARFQYNMEKPDGKTAYADAKFYGKRESTYSIGYRTRLARMVKGIRRLRDLDLFEYGPVLNPANRLATLLSIKDDSEMDPFDDERIDFETETDETKARRYVHNAEYWGLPVGTPITASMRPRGTGSADDGKPATHGTTTTPPATSASAPALSAQQRGLLHDARPNVDGALITSAHENTALPMIKAGLLARTDTTGLYRLTPEGERARTDLGEDDGDLSARPDRSTAAMWRSNSAKAADRLPGSRRDEYAKLTSNGRRAYESRRAEGDDHATALEAARQIVGHQRPGDVAVAPKSPDPTPTPNEDGGGSKPSIPDTPATPSAATTPQGSLAATMGRLETMDAKRYKQFIVGLSNQDMEREYYNIIKIRESGNLPLNAEKVNHLDIADVALNARAALPYVIVRPGASGQNPVITYHGHEYEVSYTGGVSAAVTVTDKDGVATSRMGGSRTLLTRDRAKARENALLEALRIADARPAVRSGASAPASPAPKPKRTRRAPSLMPRLAEIDAQTAPPPERGPAVDAPIPAESTVAEVAPELAPSAPAMVEVTPELLDEAASVADDALGITEAADGTIEVTPEVAARQDRVAALIAAEDSGDLSLSSLLTEELTTTRSDLVDELRLQSVLATRQTEPKPSIVRSPAGAPDAPPTRPGLAGAAEDYADALRSGDAGSIARTRRRLESSVRRSRAGSDAARGLADHIGDSDTTDDADQLATLATTLRTEARARRADSARKRRTAKRLERARIQSLIDKVDAELGTRTGPAPADGAAVQKDRYAATLAQNYLTMFGDAGVRAQIARFNARAKLNDSDTALRDALAALLPPEPAPASRTANPFETGDRPVNPGTSSLRGKQHAQRVDADIRRTAHTFEQAKRDEAAQRREQAQATRAALNERPTVPPEKLAGAKYVLDRRYGTWEEVVRVNKTTVSVKTGYSWTNKIPLSRIIDARGGPEPTAGAEAVDRPTVSEPAPNVAPPPTDDFLILGDSELANLLNDYADDDETVNRILGEMDRRQAAEAVRPEVNADDQWAVFDGLIASGVDSETATEQALGIPVEQQRRTQAIDQLRTQGYSGRNFDELARRSYRDHVAGAYRQAEDDTRGQMLIREGVQAEIDPFELFSGPEARARRWASPELKEWWDINGRPTFAEYRTQLLGGTVGPRAEGFLR